METLSSWGVLNITVSQEEVCTEAERGSVIVKSVVARQASIFSGDVAPKDCTSGVQAGSEEVVVVRVLASF